jgi:hypothetical protein
MANPLSKLSDAALIKSLKCRYFEAESTKFLEKVHILALIMTIFENLALEPIWVGLLFVGPLFFSSSLFDMIELKVSSVKLFNF